MTPLATVVIPTYNRVALLRRAVESARRQEHENLRILICDNASSDATAEYCQRVAAEDSRILVHRQTTNVGPSGNFTTGLRLAEGEFFMWLADDDWLEPSYVRLCVAALVANPSAVVASGRSDYYNGEDFHSRSLPFELLAQTPEQRIVDYFWSVRDNPAFYGVYRLPWVRDISIASRLGEDWHFLGEALVAGGMLAVPDATINRDGGGISGDFAALVRRVGGVPAFLSGKPHIVVAWNVFRQIASGDGLYSRIEARKRVGLGVRSAISIAGRFSTPKWIGRHIPRKGRVRRLVGALR